MQTPIDRVVNPGKLDKVQIANAIFLVDHDARALRDSLNPANQIPFRNLPADNTGRIDIVFDKLTRNIYQGYLPADGGLPPMTERVSLAAGSYTPYKEDPQHTVQERILDKLGEMWDRQIMKGDDYYREHEQPEHQTADRDRKTNRPKRARLRGTPGR